MYTYSSGYLRRYLLASIRETHLHVLPHVGRVRHAFEIKDQVSGAALLDISFSRTRPRTSRNPRPFSARTLSEPSSANERGRWRTRLRLPPHLGRRSDAFASAALESPLSSRFSAPRARPRRVRRHGRERRSERGTRRAFRCRAARDDVTVVRAMTRAAAMSSTHLSNYTSRTTIADLVSQCSNRDDHSRAKGRRR